MDRNPIIDVTDVLRARIYLGVFDTYNARSQVFDITAWKGRHGPGTFQVALLRPGDTTPYAVSDVTVEGALATWTFDATDTAIAGQGVAFLSYANEAGTILDKTVDIPVLIASNSGPVGQVAPDPLSNWYDDVLTASAEAKAASQSARDAKDAAEAAEAAAETAQGKAEDAQTAAETAQGKAEDAQTAAEAAQTAAETAQGKAEDAQTAAETAQGKAEDAQSAAEAAQTAAETAQGKAEDAQTAAETAQGKAEDAQSAAETAQGKAETAQGKAEDAQTAAEAAQGKAEDAQSAAETAQTAAETAQGKAEDAQTAAETAEGDAEAWAIGKRDGVDVPSTDPAYHNNAKYWAEYAGSITPELQLVIVDGALCQIITVA